MDTEESNLLDINPELTLEDLPELLAQVFLVLKVRLIKLTKARPLDMGSVLSDKEEQDYFTEVVGEASVEKDMETLSLDGVEKLLLKHLEASEYQFVKLPDDKMIEYNEEDGLDIYADLGETEPERQKGVSMGKAMAEQAFIQEGIQSAVNTGDHEKLRIYNQM